MSKDRKTLPLPALILMLLLAAVAGTLLVNFGNANPLPDINPSIKLESPQNATYKDNAITVNFSVAANWGVYPVFYSLDGQAMKLFENMTMVSREEGNIGKSPTVYRTTLRGSLVLSNLSEGWHNVTLYLVTEDAFSLYRTYEKGEVLRSKTFQFVIDPPDPFQVAPLVTASVAAAVVVGVGSLVYLKKRQAVKSQ